jgi:opacity protein-like surface antigen
VIQDGPRSSPETSPGDHPYTNIMRSLCLLILTAATAFSGPLGFGLKAGIPLTDFTNAVTSGQFDYTSKTQRYIVGPVVELRLPAGFGIEADALYRRFSYNGLITGTGVTSSTSGNAWEFPIVAKYRFATPVARPFIAGGIAWDTLQGLKQDVRTALANAGITSSSTPTELNKKTTTGFVLGFGVDVHALVIHISPDIRYTRWGAQHNLVPNGGFHSSQNQAEFLVGITF